MLTPNATLKKGSKRSTRRKHTYRKHR
jgi:hypothetical protein